MSKLNVSAVGGASTGRALLEGGRPDQAYGVGMSPRRYRRVGPDQRKDLEFMERDFDSLSPPRGPAGENSHKDSLGGRWQGSEGATQFVRHGQVDDRA